MSESQDISQTSRAWRISEWISIALYAGLVFQYISLWRDPAPGDAETIIALTGLVLFEFVLAHSGVFMSLFPRKIALLIFVPFYGLFAIVMNNSVPGNTILILYCGVVLMRMRFMFSNPSDSAKAKAFGLSFLSVFLVMFCMIGFSAAADSLPKLGLTQAYLNAVDFKGLSGTTGDFTRSPHAAMAMGATYFTLLALLEIWIYGLLKKQKPVADAP